jgi:hypothetical protein
MAFLMASSGIAAANESPYSRWTNGPPARSDYFPIGVWLQAPANARLYREIGVNFYLGLWRGPTEEQLRALAEADMPVICSQNDVGLANRDNPIIIAWMHPDEPDNAQPLPDRSGYGPPIPPAKVIADYERWRRADPTRPVLLNLGQGVANDEWKGRGQWGKPEDYPQYVQGADIVSFDIYPVASEQPSVHGNLWLVAKGVDRLREWTRGERIVWNIVETTRIRNLDARVSPHQLRAEVWMSLIHGSRGIVYFAHQFAPRFIEAGLLADDEIREAVRAINAEIQALAPVLNSPDRVDGVGVSSSNENAPIDVMAKRHDGALYVFAVSMRGEPTTGEFRVAGRPVGDEVEVLGEGRRLDATSGVFTDSFPPYAVHLYRLSALP